MSTSREEIRQRRNERLLDQLENAAARWVEAGYQDGLDTGRRGVVSAGVRRRRELAQLKFEDIVVQLRQATKRRPPGR
jgi:hypothetical protein